MGVIASSGEQIYCDYLENKSAKGTIVLSHGLAMDSSSFHHQILHFSKDYNILSYDQRGHGKSSKPRGRENYTLEKFVDDMLNVTSSASLEKFNLVGFSIGGSIALRFAQLYPERIENVVAINAPLSIANVRKSFFSKLAIASKMPKSLIALGLDDKPIYEYQGQLATHRKCFLNMDKGIVKDIIEALKLSKPQASLNVRHLLAYSGNDEIVVPQKPASLNYAMIRNGHHYVIAQKPDEVNALIRNFIGS